MLKVIKKKVDERLRYLKNLDLDSGKVISLASVRDFKKFMSSHCHLSRPLIGLTDEGRIFAEWQEEVHIRLEFEGRKKINFGIIYPGKKVSIHGVLPMNKLKKIFDALKLWKYMLV